MKNIHIENSYNIWRIAQQQSLLSFGTIFANKILNRSWFGMYLEWYLHNIGYYLVPRSSALSERLKHVDLEEHYSP